MARVSSSSRPIFAALVFSSLCLAIGVSARTSRAANCDANGRDDRLQIAGGESLDCNQNGVPDACDIVNDTLRLAGGAELGARVEQGRPLVADSNGDGALDLVAATSGGRFPVWIHRGDGRFELRGGTEGSGSPVWATTGAGSPIPWCGNLREIPKAHVHELADGQCRPEHAHAPRWGVDAKRVGVLGFSAGGHLASSAGTHFDAGRADDADLVERQSSRPDFLVLCYPVISFTAPYTHQGSRRNFKGENGDPSLDEVFSNEKQVTESTPPTFLVHTNEDTGVPAENSIAFYLALKKAGIPAEMHIYEKGRHGLGLGPKDLPFSSWPGRCEAWLGGLGVLEPARAR